MANFATKHRPTNLSEIVGHQAEVNLLKEKLASKSLPSVIMICGESGVGKTTIARILAKEIGSHEWDIRETNCASARGIDMVRELAELMWTAPIGQRRSIILDETHRLTADAQSALLKTLEDPCPTTSFFLCTTHPQGLLPTIRSRCMMIALKPLPPKALRVLLKTIIEKEKLPVTNDDVLDKIVIASEGSGRQAIQLLEKIADAHPEDQLDLISYSGAEKTAYDLVKALIWEKLDWATMAKIIESVDDDPESLRRSILGAASKEVLKGGKNADRANAIISEFRDSWVSCGKAGLVTSVYSLLRNKSQ